MLLVNEYSRQCSTVGHLPLQLVASRQCVPLLCPHAGLFASALLLLYWMLRISWNCVVGGDAGVVGASSRGWLLDVLVLRSLVCSAVGVHVIHCLGGAWLSWLGLWIVWCSVQILMHSGGVRNGWSCACLVVAIALGLPLAAAVLPFHPMALHSQHATLAAYPALAMIPIWPYTLLIPREVT